MPTIHPTAIIDPLATLADDVVVGPYVIIEGAVTIGVGTVIQSHSFLKGPTRIGARCKVGPAAYIGTAPQHLKIEGKDAWLVVGDDCLIREGASLHRGTKPGEENATRVGDRCFLMANTHVAHDCVVSADVILANGVLLGGHVTVGPRAFLGGNCAIHQFGRVGRLAVIGGLEAVTRDVPPFAAFRYASLKGYNAIGCKRSGMSRESIHGVRRAYAAMGKHRTMPAAVAAMRDYESIAEVKEIIDFIATSKRGITPSNKNRESDRTTSKDRTRDD